MMIIKTTINLILFGSLFVLSFSATAKNSSEKTDIKTEVYQLSYIEREPGTDDYEVTMLISDRYIRIDEPANDSGYIVYDDKDRVIYSVSHHDQSVLLIKQFKFSEKDSPAKGSVEYLQLADAPDVSGKNIYNYRVYIEAEKGVEETTCTELQLVEGLLPEVRAILKRYQNVVSGQQVKMVDNRITDMQTACFYIDQIYNTGAYYDKGLPIQEWHSNERFRVLTSYKLIKADDKKFTVPGNYRQFSIDADSKTFIK
jgi:hypothetical protein